MRVGSTSIVVNIGKGPYKIGQFILNDLGFQNWGPVRIMIRAGCFNEFISRDALIRIKQPEHMILKRLLKRKIWTTWKECTDHVWVFSKFYFNRSWAQLSSKFPSFIFDSSLMYCSDQIDNGLRSALIGVNFGKDLYKIWAFISKD